MKKLKMNILVISGPRDIGKTIFCEQIIDIYKSEKVEIKGVISPGIFLNNQKSSISIVDIESRESKIFATKNPSWYPNFSVKKWIFIEDSIVWANRKLTHAVPTDLLIIDELGYLELLDRKGLTNGILAVDSGKYKVALIVIRPELIQAAQARWPDIYVFDIHAENNQKMNRKIIERISALLEIN